MNLTLARMYLASLDANHVIVWLMDSSDRGKLQESVDVRDVLPLGNENASILLMRFYFLEWVYGFDPLSKTDSLPNLTNQTRFPTYELLSLE